MAREPTWLVPRSAYVHVPFCYHKCGYCDFASLAGVDHLIDRYLAALELEVATLGVPREVDTIFIGGGTPTRPSAEQIERLLAMVRRWLPLTPGGEWTVEANPETIDERKADVLAEGGVNRVSLGAQSFHRPLLAALERDHDPESVFRAVDLVRPRFPRWSIDLIFGVPGSTTAMWERDLETAIAMGLEHVSCYGLTYEKGTPLYKQLLKEQITPVDEEAERAMLEHTIDRLAAEGLDQYEVSNYARPGAESRHNLAYWANDAYFGFGVGAARYEAGVRSSNTRDLMAYLRRVEAGQPATGPTERLDPELRARETAVLMMRRLRLGLNRYDFLRRTGFTLDELVGPIVARQVALGWVEDDGQVVRLTREGLFVADTILSAWL
jgi:oxygen-independent coproporphyrinogen-3 oxidase